MTAKLSAMKIDPAHVGTEFDGFCRRGYADFVIGGQWGSEGKGAAAAALAYRVSQRPEKTGHRTANRYDVMTTNAGAQAGHTSTHKGVERVVFHLPTAALIQHDETGIWPLIYINSGAIIDVDVLLKEIDDNKIPLNKIKVHPNAAIITESCKAAEMSRESGQTRIASTRKGVGEALARKVLRTGRIARDEVRLAHLLQWVDLNKLMDELYFSVLVEVPQGISLSVSSSFYPYTTSRIVSIAQAMADAEIHPSFYGCTCLVLRTFPIRVGNIVEDGKTLGQSGGHYSDQIETSWKELDQTPEITTVTKRVRRVFTFSVEQMQLAIQQTKPDTVFLSFCDYLEDEDAVRALIGEMAIEGEFFQIIGQFGPTTDDHAVLEYIE